MSADANRSFDDVAVQNQTTTNTEVSGVTVTANVNPNNNNITFFFSNGDSAVFDRLNYPVVSRDPGSGGQLSPEDVALKFAISHVGQAANATDAVSQQAYANMLAGIATTWLAGYSLSGSSETIAQPALPNGTQVSPITVTALRSELAHGIWSIDKTAGQPGGVGNNDYDQSTGNWIVRITPEAVNRYASITGGMEYLIGHELGHNTTGGLNAQDYFYHNWLSTEINTVPVYGPDSTNWQNDEVYANLSAYSITAFLGQSHMAEIPGYGYLWH